MSRVIIGAALSKSKTGVAVNNHCAVFRSDDDGSQHRAYARLIYVGKAVLSGARGAYGMYTAS